ncbi:hypothetical protein [Planomonospora algeriensis]
MTANVAPRPQVSPVVYSGLLGKVVRTIEPHSEADPVGILGSLLSAFSSAITNLPQVHYGTQSQTLSTWIVLIGNTGMGRKGTATRAALGIVRSALPDWANSTILEGCPQSGPAYVSTLADMNGNALMVEEEFADLLKVSARYKSFGKAIRRSWEGASISNRTKEAVIHVDAPHVAIIGNVTPAEFGSSIGKADKAGGSLNRFLCLYVSRSKKIKLSEQISSAQWAELVRPLVREFRSAVTFARNVEEVTVSKAALTLWDDKLSEMIDSMTLGRESMEQFAARAADYVWRLSALYALADRREEISTTDLEAAVGLVSYMCDSVTYLSPEVANAGGSTEESLALRVENFIKAAGEEGVTSTVLLRKYGRKAAEMNEIISELPNITMTKVQPNGGGRPALVYRYEVQELEETNLLDSEEDAPETVAQVIDSEEPAETAAPEVILVEDFTPEEDADFWAETEEETVIKAQVLEASAEVSSAVRNLRMLLEAQEAKAEPEEVTKPQPTFTGVSGLRALLEGTQEEEETATAAETAAEPVWEAQPLDFPEVNVHTLGHKVPAVPAVIFQAPAGEEVAA